MKNKLILIAVFIFCSFPVFSQQNILLKGKIIADSLHDSSIHIINLTQKTGTVNTASGNFEILVRENDILLFSSIEFENKEIVITPAILKDLFLRVELKIEVNQLDEIPLSNITLTGNINTDINNIKIVKDLPLGLSAADLKDIKLQGDVNDPLKNPENLAFHQNNILQETSVDLIAVAGLISDLIGVKKPKKERIPPGSGKPISLQIRTLFADDFFLTSLKIKEEKIGEFLFYLDDQNIDRQLLFEENRMALIELLIHHSEKYRTPVTEN